MWPWIDRSAWAAMGQETPGVWSWPRAVAVIVVAAVSAAVIYVLVYSEPAFLVGLAVAYAFVLWRARRRHEELSAHDPPHLRG
jgi:hypothetical protein